MNRKKALYICIVIAVLLLLAFLLIYMHNRPYRWSRNVCDAIRVGDTDKALLLIDNGIRKGYDLNTLSERPSFLWRLLEATPQTPLQVACKYGNYSVAAKLLENGAEPTSVKGGINSDPLLCVLRRHYLPNDKELVQLLLNYGSDVSHDNGMDNIWTNAAQRAPRNFNAAVDPNTGAYPYDETVARGITEVFVVLSEGYVDDAVNEAYRTPLHCAIMMQNWYLTRVLVKEFGCSLNAKDVNGNTAYDLALENGAPLDILDLLKCQ